MLVLLFPCLFVFVSCEEVIQEISELSRKPRFFTFKNIDDDITVNLEFSIPFITVPFKKHSSPLNGLNLGFPKININPISIILGGGFILAAVKLVPLLLKHDTFHQKSDKGRCYIKEHLRALFQNSNARSRSEITHFIAILRTGRKHFSDLDSTSLDPSSVLDIANEMLADPASFQTCALKIACWTGHNKSSLGQTRKLRYKILSTMVNATAIDEAVSHGQSGRSCTKYSPCPLRRDQVSILMERLSELTQLLLHFSGTNI